MGTRNLAESSQGRRHHRGAARGFGPLGRKSENGKIDNYQCIVPTTWNGSPRDPKGNIGAFEAALMNTKVVNAEQPVEILRTLHSFDPCLACSTHIMDKDGKELTRVKVL